MTQAPQAAPAGWYPSPDGAPVHRWWDGAMWTDATRQLPPPPQAPLPQAPPPEAPPRVELGPAMSGWPAPPTPNLGPLALVTQVFVALAGLAVPVAWAARAWPRPLPAARHPGERAQLLAGGAAGVDGAGLGQRGVGVQRDESVQDGVQGLDLVEGRRR